MDKLTDFSSNPRNSPFILRPTRVVKSPRLSGDIQAHSGSATPPTNFSNKPPATFISSLSIPVEGAIPIHLDPSEHSMPLAAGMSQQPSTSEPKRAPRKSKTDALAALHRSTALAQDDFGHRERFAAFTDSGPPIPVSSKLDLSSVKTSSPRDVLSTQPRPFGLEDCPVFHPTTEEFKDPMAYIRSISDRARDFGICKIVPPVGWKMPFVTDTENFRFKTRLQRLNSIEASSRAKVNFLEQLYRFHKQQGNPRVAVPTINHKPLDLWLLRKEVDKLGGYDAVTRGKKWSDLGRILGYSGIPGLSTQIKNSYTRVILPYEHFCERVRNSPSMSPVARDPQLKTHTNIQTSGKSSRVGAAVTKVDDTSPPSSPLTATSSPLSEPPDDGDYGDYGDYGDESASPSISSMPRKSTRTGSQEQITPTPKQPGACSLLPSPIILPVFHDKNDMIIASSEQNCEVCHKKNRGEEMLLCDGCDCGFHIFCLDPPLTTIPKGQWYCHTCLFGTGGDFGFDEGEEHSLASFQARDLEFRRMWFESHPPRSWSPNNMDISDPMVNRFGEVSVSEYDVENEFWRLVQSPHETVEIEYGADVHSTTHGSAMPTIETHPLNSFSKDPWNLNNIPIVPDSLLRFIKSDISGMTVPWTYVGMVFSTFCWHNEDHYTYSINFMHWGETKTWYGIPGDDAEKFEAAIKCEAPDLFEAQPDLLFQLVTLMNPKRVRDAGVRVYGCNQRAGEFVITFPKAYHAGFNHGLNFNEAVNFALPDWLRYGRDCVQRYREHRKLPVFSHDELLITITQQSQSVKTAMWLIESLEEMTNREMNDRRRARSLGFSEILEAEDRSEDQYQCAICKTFCYLSQVTCQCTGKVVCVEHAHLLCEQSNHSLVLRKRFSDAELLETRARVAERAAIPSVWRDKLNKALIESARPPLRSLRALLAEGDRINFYLPELSPLRKCVSRASVWTEAANGFIVRKQSRKRSRRRGRPSLNEVNAGSMDDPGDRPDKSLDDLYALLREVEGMGFDCPEIAALQTLAQQAEEIKKTARTFLNSGGVGHDRATFIQECDRLLLKGSSLNVHLDELLEVEKALVREQLIKELDDKLEDATLTLDEVREFLTRARACNLPPDNKHLKLLEARQRAGNTWEDRAKNVLAQAYKTIEELDDFVNMESNTPIDPTVLNRLMSSRAKAKEYERQAKAWLTPEPENSKPKVQEVVRFVTRAEKEFSIPAIRDLKRMADFALDLETRCDQVLKNRYQHQSEGREPTSAFDTMRKWKIYARDHLKMFSLPVFDKLEAQMNLHFRWVEGLPWYCREHKVAHGQVIFDDVLETTQHDDDLPPADEYFSCICPGAVRPPPRGTISDAVQCDHCFARFHGPCAANGGSCPFCDHHHWNGAIHKNRSWHFCFLPSILLNAPDITKNYSLEWKQLEVIVHRLDRLSAAIGQFLSFASRPGNLRKDYIPQVRHYMRKLFKIQFAVSPNPEVSFGLDLAGLHRILAAQPDSDKTRPKFIFGQDLDQDWMDGTRCICRGRTTYLVNYPSVVCKECQSAYHAGCVFFPLESLENTNIEYECPLCCLHKNKKYKYSQVRVKPLDELNLPQDTYVDTAEMYEIYSRDIIYMTLPPPFTHTLFVELVNFVPGNPGPDEDEEGGDNNNGAASKETASNGTASNVAANNMAASNGVASGSSSRTGTIQMVRQPGTPPGPSYSRLMHTVPPPPLVPVPATFDVTKVTAINPPVQPPPWSRWGTMSTPSRPPSTQRRQPPGETPRGTPQPSRKRKHIEMGPTEDHVASSSTKRRVVAQVPITQPAPPRRSVQTLSPSLAMIVSPTETPPRPSFIPPSDNPPQTIRTVKLVMGKGK